MDALDQASSTPIDGGGIWTTLSIPTGSTMTNTDLSGDNPCIEFDDYGCGMYNLEYTYESSTCEGCTKSNIVPFRNCCENILNCNSTADSCNDDIADGSIDLILGNGNAPFTFIWDSGQTTQNLQDVFAGTYCVTVTDAIGCGSNICCEVLQEDNTPEITCSIGINFEFQPIDPNCEYFVCEDDVIIVRAGGPNDFEPGISYTIEGPNGFTSNEWQVFAPPISGTWTLTKCTPSGCCITTNLELTFSPTMEILCSSLPDNCTDDVSDGSIDITIAGGVSPYTYLWDNGDVTEDISNLISGIYCVTVVDSFGCEVKTCCEVLQEENNTELSCSVGINFEFQPLDPNCEYFVCEDDVIIVRADGPNGFEPNIFYTIEGPNGFTSNDWQVFAPPVSGIWTLTKCTAGNCCTTETLELTFSNSIDITCNANPDTCEDDIGNGSVEINFTGGIAPFIYLWDNGETTKDIDNLESGTYCITITDSIGCESSVCCEVLQEDNTPDLTCSLGVNFVFQPIDANCEYFVCEDDDIIVRAGGPNDFEPSMDYTIEGPNGFFSNEWQVFAPPISGTWTLTKCTQDGCCATIDMEVTFSQSIDLSCSSEPDNCTDNIGDGSIDLSVQSGVSPYTYIWDNGETTQDIQNLESGVYCVTVSNTYGCESSLCCEVLQEENTPEIYCSVAVNFNFLPIDPDCEYEVCEDDAIIVRAGGPNDFEPNLNYLILGPNGFTSTEWQVFAPPVSGIWTLTKCTPDGCCITTELNLTFSPTIELSCNSNPDNCTDDISDGSIDLIVAGGVSPFTFQWDNGSVTEDLQDLDAGTYCVTVTDSFGCQSNLCCDILQEENTPDLTCSIGINFEFQPIDPNCEYFVCTGDDIIVRAGGPNGFEPGLNYTIEGPNGFVSNEWQVFAPPISGMWTLTKCTQDNCCISTDMELTFYEKITTEQILKNGSIVTDSPSNEYSCCEGDQFTITFLPFDGNCSYEIESPSGGIVTGNSQLFNNVDPSDSGTYIGRSICNGICEEEIEVDITVTPGFSVFLGTTVNQGTDCDNTDAGINAFVIGGSTGPYTYLWNTGSTATGFLGSQSTPYSVTVTDSNGCTDEAAFTSGCAAGLVLCQQLVPTNTTSFPSGNSCSYSACDGGDLHIRLNGICDTSSNLFSWTVTDPIGNVTTTTGDSGDVFNGFWTQADAGTYTIESNAPNGVCMKTFTVDINWDGTNCN